MSGTFQRARRPEQKQERRAAILDAARALAAERGVQEVTLAAVAEAVGLARSNVLRYFATREEIYLRLMVDEWRAANDALAAALPAGTVPLDELAATLAAAVAARPLFCDLSAVLPGTLERGVPVDLAWGYKLEIMGEAERLAGLLGDHGAELTPALALEAVTGIGACVMGLWPSSNPPAALAERMEDPATCHMLIDFEPTLARLSHALLVGLVATA